MSQGDSDDHFEPTHPRSWFVAERIIGALAVLLLAWVGNTVSDMRTDVALNAQASTITTDAVRDIKAKLDGFDQRLRDLEQAQRSR